MSQGNCEQTRPELEHILKTSSDTSPKLRAFWLSEIADSYKAEGDLEHAELYYKKAIDACLKCGSKYKKDFNRLELADTFIKKGQVIKGLAICREILSRVNEQTSNLIPMNAESFLASGLVALDSCEQAIVHFKRSNRIFIKSAAGFSADDLRIGFVDINLNNLRGISECYQRLYQQTGRSVYLDSLLRFEEQQRALVLRDRVRNRQSFNERVRVLRQDTLYQQSCMEISRIQSQLRQTAKQDTALIDSLLKELENEKLTLLMRKAEAESGIDSDYTSTPEFHH
ncbi:MAG: hypothetical protein U5R06_04400 [candidate division KSB1 bacterium]|nr:hypothetical protein [candidate division KSB1 bacterium]